MLRCRVIRSRVSRRKTSISECLPFQGEAFQFANLLNHSVDSIGHLVSKLLRRGLSASFQETDGPLLLLHRVQHPLQYSFRFFFHVTPLQGNYCQPKISSGQPHSEGFRLGYSATRPISGALEELNLSFCFLA